MLSKVIQQAAKDLAGKRTLATFPRTQFHLPTPPTKSQTVHCVGVVATLGGITAGIAMSPLDEFEKIDRNNDCYHHHLHPR
mmetsp:Transcript_4681/g.5389  ORF Transcript_4681/g.5389 Transcript_4681/m.5389 type:complete len:81 (-) Transcript_4681:383-625(-)